MVKKGNIPWNKGMKMSDEFCRINSESHKGQNAWNKGLIGEGNSMFGKHHSDETKQKMSRSHNGKKLSKEHKKNLSEAMKQTYKDGRINPMYGRTGEDSPLYGRKHSEKTLQKMRITALQSWDGNLERRKMASERFQYDRNPGWNPNRNEVFAPYGPNYHNKEIRVEKQILQKNRDLLDGNKINFNNSKSYAFHHIDYDKSNDGIDNMCWLSKLNHNRITNYRKNELISLYFKNILQYNLQLLKKGKIPITWTSKNKNLFIEENKNLNINQFINNKLNEVIS